MKILITGHLGLIGSELISQLAPQGHELIGCDDLSHNCVEPQAHVRHFLCPVHQLAFFETSLSALDLIIHCACLVGPALLTPAAQVAWQIIQNTQAVLELAQRTGAHLITFSSSEVLAYKGETDIRAQYALGKLASEAMVLGSPNVDGRVIRPYNVTGRHQRADGGFVMPRFRDAALAGQPLTVFGSGEQVRHFTHVSDFARFVLLLIEKWPERKSWSVFSPRNGIDMLALAEMFAAGASQTARFTFMGQLEAAASLANENWRPSGDRPLDPLAYDACLRLGWEPRVTLEAIVREHLGGVR